VIHKVFHYGDKSDGAGYIINVSLLQQPSPNYLNIAFHRHLLLSLKTTSVLGTVYFAS